MKTILVLIIVLVLFCIKVLLFNTSELPAPASDRQAPKDDNTGYQYTQSNNSWLEKFYIGAMQEDIDYKYSYAHLDSLGFNLWHQYVEGDWDPLMDKWKPRMKWINGISKDSLMSPVNAYAGEVNGIIDQIYSHNRGRKLIAMRPKITWLCYGQRSDYKCNDDMTTYAEKELWFYHFQSPNHKGRDITDNSNFGNGVKVRYCQTNVDNAGLVVSRLKANTEQCNRASGWWGDSESDWIIKPRIRIPVDFPKSHPETPVCKIRVLSQDTNLVLKDVVIKGKYFLDSNNQYDGKYIEEYNYDKEPVNMKIHGDWGDNYVYSARGNADKPDRNHADIQVSWYGNCDMWIDYVRVDNDVADQLFKGQFDDWITEEARQIGVDKIMKYYLELVEFNNLPCMAYVNNKLHQIPGAPDLMQDLTNTISLHVPWEIRVSVENAEFLYHQYIQKVGFTQVFSESYPLTACYTINGDQQSFSRIPYTLPIKSGTSVPAQAISPSLYDEWLQDNLNHKPYLLEEGGTDARCGNTTCGNKTSTTVHHDNGNFRFQIRISDSLSRLANIPFIFMPQAHYWFIPVEIRREPTNEELKMMVNVALSYGARGLLYFMYTHKPDELDPPCKDEKGIADNDDNLRTINNYGQDNPNKKQTILSIVERLTNKWGPYLLSFNNEDRHSYIYDYDITERNNLVNNSYFNDIVTYKPGSIQTSCPGDNPGFPNPSGLIYECKNERYVQVATFKKTQDDGNKYFMIVNRRCSPFIDESSEDNRGGKRNVRVIFHANSSFFANFNNWKIIDLLDDSTVLTFDKRTSSLLDLGWFMPGEGKLYKIVPVHKYGIPSIRQVEIPRPGTERGIFIEFTSYTFEF